MATVAPDGRHSMPPGAHDQRHAGASLATNAKEEGQGGLEPVGEPGEELPLARSLFLELK